MRGAGFRFPHDLSFLVLAVATVATGLAARRCVRHAMPPADGGDANELSGAATALDAAQCCCCSIPTLCHHSMAAVTDICLTMCNMVTLCVTVFSVARGGGGNLNNGPARSVQSASHDGTDPPKLTFEARLTTFTSNVVRTGRLSRHSK